jgi:hypothetical protein
MTAKKKPAARVRKRPSPKIPPPPMAVEAGEDRSPPTAPTASSAPPNFGLLFTHLDGGRIVLSATAGYTTFRSKADAAEWLRGFARTIETSWPNG